MPIEWTDSRRKTYRFADLKVGDTFTTPPSGPEVWMKTEREPTSDNNCVSLPSGKLGYMENEDTVNPVTVKMEVV